MNTLEMTPLEKLYRIEELFAKVNHGNKGKVVRMVADRAGKSRITVKQHWLTNTSTVPEEYRDLTIEELEKFLETQPEK